MRRKYKTEKESKSDYFVHYAVVRGNVEKASGHSFRSGKPEEIREALLQEMKKQYGEDVFLIYKSFNRT